MFFSLIAKAAGTASFTRRRSWSRSGATKTFSLQIGERVVCRDSDPAPVDLTPSSSGTSSPPLQLTPRRRPNEQHPPLPPLVAGAALLQSAPLVPPGPAAARIGPACFRLDYSLHHHINTEVGEHVAFVVQLGNATNAARAVVGGGGGVGAGIGGVAGGGGGAPPPWALPLLALPDAIANLHADVAALRAADTANATAVAAITTAVAGLRTDATATTAALAGMRTDINANTAAVAAMRIDVATNIAAVAALRIDVTTHTTALGALRTDVTTSTAAVTPSAQTSTHTPRLSRPIPRLLERWSPANKTQRSDIDTLNAQTLTNIRTYYGLPPMAGPLTHRRAWLRRFLGVHEIQLP
ncbi:hypothetical protein BDK51DRAFT_49653 [Blyttiomyces helicus]|uniref:Uncharacterized protein n=1 Tax=Blyttiomyces helicus TaxID=388810 RepID=A0A4P9VXQ9_9FUNG|nr:hypothetical protein BDK51DRAFT_49653 [Blyttiomyces helicus]|eukprot:RKO84524.1 hypothetical protein BDK51DRAFT_49653 [Blyttiomyces helicus]